MNTLWEAGVEYEIDIVLRVLTVVRTLFYCQSKKYLLLNIKTQYGANKNLVHRAQGKEKFFLLPLIALLSSR